MTTERGPHDTPENPEDTHPFYPPTPPVPSQDPYAAAPQPPTDGRGLRPGVVRATMAASLVAAGLVVGGGIGFVAGHASGSGSGTSSTAFQIPDGAFGGEGFGAQGGSRGFGSGGPGGVAGEEHLQGTLTRVGSDSITVRTASGTATYQVDGSTQIVRNGQAATLSALRTGEQVLVHVYPSSSGGRLVVERILAGTLPAYGDGHGFGHDGSSDDSTGSGSTT